MTSVRPAFGVGVGEPFCALEDIAPLSSAAEFQGDLKPFFLSLTHSRRRPSKAGMDRILAQTVPTKTQDVTVKRLERETTLSTSKEDGETLRLYFPFNVRSCLQTDFKTFPDMYLFPLVSLRNSTDIALWPSILR